MNLLIISNNESQLSQLLAASFDRCDVIRPDAIAHTALDRYDAFAVLGGVDAEPLTLLAPDRNALGAQMQKGKRVLAEYTRGIGQVSFLEVTGTRFERPVLLCAQGGIAESLPQGTILDEQSNQRVIVYKATNRTSPILQYVPNPEGFYAVPHPERIKPDPARFALWLDEPGLLVCTFRLSNFAKAKFAPRSSWSALLDSIISWLGGSCPSRGIAAMFADAYTMGQSRDIRTAIGNALRWYQGADLFVYRDGLPYAVREGMGANVSPDGMHAPANELRLDCTGETSLMFYLKYLLDGNAGDLDAANGLSRFALDMQITELCPQYGMVRCSLTGWWNVNYQDDTSRGFLLPAMWRALFSGDKSTLPRVQLALDYLLRSTGTDGLRAVRLDFYDMYSVEVQASGLQCLTDEEARAHAKWSWGGGVDGITTMEELRARPAGTPSAHYNAYYMAALLLGYKLLGDDRYLQTALRGMQTLMDAYPNTAREHSETQEMCRLILPLSLLYWVTKEDDHRAWLYRVTEDLQRVRHPSGGYLEWDTGYTAICAQAKEAESSAFAINGDPVCDTLYSINWLPFSFMIAHFVTGDALFYTLWQDITAFFASVQIHSGDPHINGAWTRAIDMDAIEVYGVPNDVGWSPWSIESGWTMAEVTSGMILGLLKERLVGFFE